MPKGPVSKIANACAESASAGAENKGEEIGEKMSKLNINDRNLTPVKNVKNRIPGAPEKIKQRIRPRGNKIHSIGDFSDEPGEGS
jgi:hypothetical protein